jgi:hypothetical protein
VPLSALCLVTVEQALIVKPLFSNTSTGAEVWLVLCELCLSHPSVDVYAHMCWKWMEPYMVLTTSMCRVDGRSVTCTTLCSMFGYSGCKP